MKILIKFNLIKKEKNTNELPFLFWSCVLDTSIEKVDYAHLNRENEHQINDCKSILLKMEYCKYSEASIKDLTNKHQKRHEYFVALDKTWLKGSPYRNSSSHVETYYQDTIEFIQQLRKFCGFNSDYELYQLQHNIIKLIKNVIGIDILKNESIAGALSIYNKLPSFDVDGNYNSARGERYIAIAIPDNLFDYKDLSVQIEILDNDKILHNALQSLVPDFKYTLPDYLENFSQLCVSVFGKKSSEITASKIYEEKFHLVRSFNIGMSIGGSHSKIVQNRYLNKQEKIDIYDHIENISNNPKDFFDIEQSYESLILGKKKEYLETKYFDNTSVGRTAFLDWIRKKLHGAKSVKIIDAYFDIYGLNDFSSCCNSIFQLTIVTTNPQKRKETKDYITNTKNLQKEISSVFPDSKIYYVPKLHDRYLYIENDRERKLYSFSNSWNGTVNNFSMFIQEVSFEASLQIYEEINNYTIKANLQELPVVTTKKEHRAVNNDKKYTKAYINTLIKNLKLINIKTASGKIINITSELFFAHYYGKDEKESVHEKISECLESLSKQKIHNLIDITTEKLLIEQKKSFDTEEEYINGKSFSWYDTPRKCLERLSDINIWYKMLSYELNLNYGLTELLNICFKMYPMYTIDSLLKHEKRICIKKTSQETIEYHVSEYIIQAFLTEYYPINGIISEQTWKFIEKTDSTYIRLFFALSIINEALLLKSDSILSFKDIIGFFTKLKLHQNEIAVVLGYTLNTIILRKQIPDKLKNDYRSSIIGHVVEKFKEQELVDFAFLAFIESFDINVKDLIEFIESLKQHNKRCEAENIEKLFLLYALQTNQKLQNKVCTLLKTEQKKMNDYFCTKEKKNKEPSDIDIKKFILSLQYLGSIFAHNLETNKDISEFEKIIFSLPADMTLIFNTKFPSKLTLFYYDLLFLLNTVYYLKDKNLGKNILDFTDWYLPVCVDCYPNDFYGLGLRIVGLYAELITDEKKKSLLNRLTYLPMKALVASAIKEQSAQTIEFYRLYIKQYEIDDYDKSIPLKNFLTIGISLCIRCTDECNIGIKTDILDCIIQINEKIKPNITEEVKPILDYGIEYAKTSSSDRKNSFIDSMNGKFFPHQAECLMEEENA